MKKRTLSESVSDSVAEFNWIISALATARPSGTLSAKSYEFFDLVPALLKNLESSKSLLSLRDLVLTAVQAFPASESKITPGEFNYNGSPVSYKQGRFLLLQSYLSTTWALYDSMSKVCGILCCTDDRAKNTTKPTKLPEDFLNAKAATVGARIHDHLKGSYGWPAAISYALRNWLVHDGYAHDGTELFKYEVLTPGGEFELGDDAWESVQKKCQGEYKATSTQTRLATFPDVQRDVVNGLVTCHAEIDEGIGFLLLWAAHCMKLQVEFLCARDVP